MPCFCRHRHADPDLTRFGAICHCGEPLRWKTRYIKPEYGHRKLGVDILSPFTPDRSLAMSVFELSLRDGRRRERLAHLYASQLPKADPLWAACAEEDARIALAVLRDTMELDAQAQATRRQAVRERKRASV